MSEAGLARRIDGYKDARETGYDGIGPITINVAGADGPTKSAQFSIKVANGLARRAQGKCLAGGLLIARNGCRELPCRSGPIEGQNLRIGNAKHSLCVHLDIAQEDVLIGNVDQVVLRMPGDVATAATDRVVALLGPERVRHGRGEHEEARNADVVECVVSGPMRSLALTVKPGHHLDG